MVKPRYSIPTSLSSLPSGIRTLLFAHAFRSSRATLRPQRDRCRVFLLRLWCSLGLPRGLPHDSECILGKVLADLDGLRILLRFLCHTLTLPGNWRSGNPAKLGCEFKMIHYPKTLRNKAFSGILEKSF